MQQIYSITEILNVIEKYINVIIHRKYLRHGLMLTVTPKLSRLQNINDKQNIHSIANRNDRSHPKKQNIKTGVEIKNKIKSKNILQPSPISRKNAPRDNPNLPEKVQRKILQPKNIFDNDRNTEQNISRTSSIKSIKSVTFSIEGSLNKDTSLSQLTQRKGSILKNKLNRGQLLRNREKQSLASSNGSNSKSLGQTVDNPNSNCIVLRKYERLLKEMKQTGQKYTDAIYPPCEQSVFLTSPYTKDFIRKLNSQGYQIKWMRLTELFKGKESCLWHSEKKSIVTKGFIHPTGNQGNYMQTVFNCINKSYLMEKFFQGQTVCQQGIYYVKMHQTQTNNWKYVIVDDFVPVIISNKHPNQGKVIKPAFLNVQSQTSVIQLWPFLVQKAFAKYYSTYDSLMKGNTLDFLQEVTGELYQILSPSINEPNDEENRDRIDYLIRNPYNIILAQNSQEHISPLRYNGAQVEILDIENNYRPKKIEKSRYQNHFKKFYIIEAKKYANHINCLIKLQNLLERQTQLQENIKPFILRSFTLQESTQCTLALTQKQERFHRNLKNTKSYSYSWIRMLLIQKQSTGYRWIESGYQRSKTLKLHACLSPGEYYIVILPEWSSKPFDLKLSLFSNSETFFQRKPYQQHGRIIQQSCMDLAQRFGKLIQVNSNICSYNYIDYNVGFIIENINNEKSSGEVKILRTIDGLDTYNITPVNSDFGQSSRLEIKIPSLESYTVVLKVSGGVDRSFLQQFDFGI